ncbi:MAG: hypothetical protein M1816_005542 [Peltula sp. TS41687]|nr:MAG: hypothetical protein M1816_005542 [Peltula sp. TS41687]
MFPRLSKVHRLMILIGITTSFFVAEISVGFHAHSLALVADAFHYMNDLVGFIVALVALKFSERDDFPKSLCFGWQRAPVLGAFFNGVFLLAIGLSIFLQAIQRIISLERVKEPKLILIMGCVGFVLNIISVVFLHENHEKPMQGPLLGGSDNDLSVSEKANPHEGHRHKTRQSVSRGRDVGMLGVLIHVLGDALNNVGVIIAALVIWLAKYDGRYYADPGVGVGIALLILVSATPLVRNSGIILLGGVPLAVDLEDVKSDLEMVPGVLSVRELHAWRLTQTRAIASAHIVISDESLSTFLEQTRVIRECLQAYGVDSVTLQPILAHPEGGPTQDQLEFGGQDPA